MWAYWWTVLKCGVRGFGERVSEGKRQVIAFFIQTSVLFGILFFVPWLGDVQNEARLVAAGVVAVILSGVLWFLWELVKAPFKLDRDKTQRISAMRRLLVRDETESEIRAQLLGFYQEGMGFFSDPIFRRTEIDMREWAERVSQFLHLHYDDTDAFTFDNADGPPKKVIAPVDSFRNKLDVLHMMLRGTHSKSYWAQRDLGEDVT